VTLKVGVVGVGQFGGHHARIFATMPGVTLAGVADTNGARAKEIASKTGSRTFDRVEDLLDEVQAVAVVVPTVDHAPVGRAALERRLATFIEKPLAKEISEAESLVRLAGDRGAVLQVGHVERFNPALRLVHDRLRAPCYIETHRLSPFRFRSADIDVVLDLMIHDIDIILHVIEAPLVRVDAIGWSLLFGREDMANARLEFADGSVANVTSSRVSAVTKRIMRVIHRDAYVSLNLIDRSAEVYRVSPELAEALGALRLEPGRSPTAEELQRIPSNFYTVDRLQAPGGEEPLRAELEAFVKAARGEGPVVVSGEHGLRAMVVAEAVLKDVREHRWGR
jgi:predicted dehydrogenase